MNWRRNIPLQTLREQAGLTQVKLAEIVGTYQTHIQALENGDKGSIDTYAKVLDVLGYEMKFTIIKIKHPKN